ncbi:MAG: hypothetical protein FGM43_08610 [Sinobacteraceae bacterium]|nr:hypothetical protein [Nevskiaceae bacterium]
MGFVGIAAPRLANVRSGLDRRLKQSYRPVRPLMDVPGHVVQTPRVRLLECDGVGFDSTVLLVPGDGRRHDPAIVLRAVKVIDFMTAHWAHLPSEWLDLCSRRTVNEVKGVSRVVYKITGKPPATIESER